MRLSINGIVVESELNDIESHYRKSIFGILRNLIDDLSISLIFYSIRYHEYHMNIKCW